MASHHPTEENEEEQFQKMGKACLVEFLQREMDISPRVATDLRIKHVFYPKAGIATGMLYAEFYSEEELDIVKRNARFLRTDSNGFRPKIVPYIPLSLFERYRAVEEHAYGIRKKDNSQTTRIWIGDDFQLRVRVRGSRTPWSNIVPEKMPILPPQAPKKAKGVSDLMDARRPTTPRSVIMLAPSSSFFSNNIYENLKEVSA